MIDRIELAKVAASRLNLPYKMGSKWMITNPDPTTPIDCSGFVRWVWGRMGVKIPDGSWNQMQATRVLKPGEPVLVGDVGFFQKDGSIHHVGLVYDDGNMIEARGQMILSTGEDAGERVLLRPRAKWEAFDQFKAAGGYRRFVAVDAEEIGG